MLNDLGFAANISLALQWVLDNSDAFEWPITTVNMSMGWDPSDLSNTIWNLKGDEIRQKIDALTQQGIAVVVSTGNDYFLEQSEGLSFPASYAPTVSVGAVWPFDAVGNQPWSSGAWDFGPARDELVSFCQRGQLLDLLAPGVGVTTSLRDSLIGFSGTSAAAPVVSRTSIV